MEGQYDPGGKRVNSYLHETREDQLVPGASNVRYILRCARCLTLLINLVVDGLRVAHAENAAIEDLPLRLTVNVANFGCVTKAKTINAVKSLDSLEGVGKGTKWVVEGTLLKICVDLTEGPELSRKTEAGTWALLASIQSQKVGSSTIQVSMKLNCEGGGSWPIVSSPESLTAISEDTTPMNNVSRTLEYSSERSGKQRSASPALDQGILKLDDNVVLDVRCRPIVKLRLNISGKYGCVVGLTRNILDNIGAILTVDCSGSAVTPLRIRPGANKRVNAELYLEDTGDETLVIEFDVSKNNGQINENKSLLISKAVKVSVGNRCVVDFLASRPVAELPSFMDAYLSVCRFLKIKPNPLDSLEMCDVRKFVADDLRQYEMSREFKNLVWEAVRRYVLESFMPVEPSSSPLPTPLHELY